ncbi:MAG TPA: hypothetical protein VFV68_15400 [Agriterribacter sp.]|nr:hypothetical protein [Agriterribacter sp.]
MKPFIVLLVVFVIAVFAIKMRNGEFNVALSARIAMCAMLVFTAMAHFAFTKGMVMMMPQFIPFKTGLVYLSGILEIVFGIGLLVPAFRLYAGWILIVFFILLLPANIKSAMEHVDYQKGSFDGHGLRYLWFRIPLQIFFIGWVYFSAVKS